MREQATAVDQRSLPPQEVEIPPRPQWLPVPRPFMPPRPKRLSEQPESDTAQPREEVETVIKLGEPELTRPGDWKRDATAFLISLLLHLMLLLVLWQMFRLVMRPASRGFVITSEIETGDDGSESDVLTLVDSEDSEAQSVTIADSTLVHPAPLTVGSAPHAGARASSGRGGGIGFFGSRAEANSVVFVVDKSGSMSNESRLDTAKLELANALHQLDSHQEFYVIFYDNRMVRMLAPESPPRMQPATRRNIDRCLQWLARDIDPGGGTEPRESLLAALELHPEVIFFLTDGDIDPETAAAVHLQNVQGTVIHTLCFSNDYGEQVMRQIAHENQGRYRFVDADTAMAQQQVREQAKLQSENEQKANAMLRNARRHLAQGRSSTGMRLLQKLIDQFPDTPDARVAGELLKTLSVPE